MRMSNNNLERCNAILRIDGEEIGTWRIPAKGTITKSGSSRF